MADIWYSEISIILSILIYVIPSLNYVCNRQLKKTKYTCFMKKIDFHFFLSLKEKAGNILYVSYSPTNNFSYLDS